MAELTPTVEKQSLSGDLHSEKFDPAPKLPPPAFDPELQRIAELSAKLENPLSGFSTQELVQQAEEFCQANGLNDQLENFKRGAILAANPQDLDRIPGITAEERQFIDWETTRRWKQPLMMYFIAVLSSMAAIVQGMDEAVVNGAQIFYYDRFGISDSSRRTAMIQGLVNSAPYLCCSATAPIYTAECSPAPIRGALVMQWQMWTAFGIALGDIVSVIFMDIDPDVAWRLILGSTVVAPVLVCCMIYCAPESPRWYMSKGRVADAYHAMRKLRFCELQASRDLFYIAKLLEIENRSLQGRNLLTDMWRVPRVRRAAQASGLVMFMQQFCGVNVIAYYSSQVFIEAGFTRKDALLTTMGTGLVNWVFAIPALYTIDPVPFTYSAEAFPLYIRDFGMSYATAVCWFFNFILAITFPLMLNAFKPQGAFGWYAAWCLIGWVAVFFILPETKALTLEELDYVFSVPTAKHASYQVKNFMWCFRKYVLRQPVKPLPPLYQLNLSVKN
ncbi:hypothetical protein PtA15_15A167 [Puccinia triticina]|uniref:Major facilitator superfamily (MFS) profile domain-containing protein n=1 Tax=Puccinia triticina TaxID=208348 RepID=A0ABY7D708_9BASI|nr:uncharacterized protein PtA15_15A167 [Puccinia triticina]WAQ91775.1 hypothetical protein PtA15_15A167 [Puccinia triticina]